MQTFAQKQNQPQKAVSSDLARSHTATSGLHHRADRILHLQRTIGNQAVLRLLQTHPEKLKAGLTGPASPYFGHDFSRVPIHPPAAGAIQTKLAINEAGDEYEQEADRVAEHVMRMPEPRLQRACACGGGCPKCQTEQPGREHESLQTKRVQASDSGQIAAPSIVHEVLRSPGQPLDPSARGFMESRFGHGFGGVRVHADAKSAESARAVNALAYTVGSDVVFGAGQYAPGTARGRQVLAHELTHVVQQGGGRGEGRGAARLQRLDFSFSDVLEEAASAALGPVGGQVVRLYKQPTEDLVASVKESPQHVGEFFKDEVWEAIKNHWFQIVAVTIGLIAAEVAVGVLLAIPEPTLLTKVIAVILQIAIIAILGYFVGVELKGAYEQGREWLSAAKRANGMPAVITEASRAFVRMVWHIIMAVLALAGVRAKIRSATVPRAGATTGDVTSGGAAAATGPSFADISAELALETPGTVRYRSTAAAASEARAAGLETPTRPGFQSHSTASAVRQVFGVSGAAFQSAHILPQAVYRALARLGISASPGRALTTLLPPAAHRAFDSLWIREWNAAIAAGRPIRVQDVYAMVSRAIRAVDDNVINPAVKGAIEERLRIELFQDLGLAPEFVIVPGTPPSAVVQPGIQSE